MLRFAVHSPQSAASVAKRGSASSPHNVGAAHPPPHTAQTPPSHQPPYDMLENSLGLAVQPAVRRKTRWSRALTQACAQSVVFIPSIV